MTGFKNKALGSCTLISTYFTKAFDRIKWDAVLTMMEKMGFNAIARDLIRAYITTSSFSVLVEGSPTTIFQQKQGLW